MRRAHLTNKFIDYKIDADRIAYNKKRKYCFRLIRKEKRPITLIVKYVTKRTIKSFGEKYNFFFEKR